MYLLSHIFVLKTPRTSQFRHWLQK